jgi:hypothetical protein
MLPDYEETGDFRLFIDGEEMGTATAAVTEIEYDQVQRDSSLSFDYPKSISGSFTFSKPPEVKEFLAHMVIYRRVEYLHKRTNKRRIKNKLAKRKLTLMSQVTGIFERMYGFK